MISKSRSRNRPSILSYRDEMKSSFFIPILLASLFSAILVLSGLSYCCSNALFWFRASRATGTVTSLRTLNRLVSTPTVEFDVESSAYSFRGYVPSNRRFVGERVAVLYLPQNPHVAQINTFRKFWAHPLFMVAWGALCGLGVRKSWLHGRSKAETDAETP